MREPRSLSEVAWKVSAIVGFKEKTWNVKEEGACGIMVSLGMKVRPSA